MYYDLPGKGPTLYTKPKSTTTEAKPAAPLVAPCKSTSGLPVPAVSNTSTDTAAARTVTPVVKAGLKAGAEVISNVGSAITEQGLQNIKDKIDKKQELTGVERAQAIRAGLLPAPTAVKSAPTVVSITKEAQANADKNLTETGKPLPVITEKMIQEEMKVILRTIPRSKKLSKEELRGVAIKILNEEQDKK
jgi:hypothetical protein